KLKGIERADSVIIDGHKQLYLPVGVGISIFKDPGAARAIEKQARYIIRPTSVDLGRRTIEGSRLNSALYLHAGLNLIGAGGYEYLIEQGIRKAGYLAERLKSMPDFELLLEPELNIVAYRYIPEYLRERAVMRKLTVEDNQIISRWNTALQKKQRLCGRTFVSRTSLTATCNGAQIPIVALRAVLSNPLTTGTDIDAVLEDQLHIAASLSSSIQA
ncbi:MAG: pyridoxal phosphate-dependent decarboxylase family protein, partial [Actinomycetota bacterium]